MLFQPTLLQNHVTLYWEDPRHPKRSILRTAYSQGDGVGLYVVPCYAALVVCILPKLI